MTVPDHFDLLTSRLKGANLIEASAGTGKTYTITGIFLRLILEAGMTVNEILVVTFTEAATEELKDRIRTRLREAVAFFSGETSDKEDFLEGLARQTEPEESIRRLSEALRDFDESAIFTIHGFCKRMLHENAFESGSLFDTELVADQTPLKREIAEDFWRTRFYDASPLFVNYALTQTGPEKLLTLLGNRVSQPDLLIIPRPELTDMSAAEKAFTQAFEVLSVAWPDAKEAVTAILTTDKGLNRKTYGKKSVPGWLQEMDRYLKAEAPDPVVFEKFEKFTPEALGDGTKKGQKTPEHPFFELCGDFLDTQRALAQGFEQQLLALKADLFDYAERELAERKTAANIQSFDDLLLNLRQALCQEGGEALIRKIRGKYKAALIDEFQDTDPVQYDIFKTLFHSDDHVLFLIGDPKQAIYGFRGADIFAYMEAARHTRSRYTLGTNWRSEPGLISAVNAVFQSRDHDRAFVYEEIPFLPVDAPPGRERADVLETEGCHEAPLQVWAVEAEPVTGDKKPLNKGQAEGLIIRAVAGEIARLLKPGQTSLGGRPLSPGDIAVLVRRNAEAEQMQAALAALNIPGVVHSTGDIFDTRDALELERVLWAVAQPRNEQRLRSALATDMLGVSGETLDALARDEAAWEKWLVRFNQYRRLWESRGFIRMFRQFMAGEAVLPRLMKLSDGERRCTNLLHLGELIHQADMGKMVGIAGLVKWLSEQRHQADQRTEEHPLRLESDDNAVRLVTIHKSKGLEYPVVFCPFTWGSSKGRNPKDPVLFHDEAGDRCPTFDLGSDQMVQHRIFAQRELLAENLRLLYVALTRARNRCYLVWGRFNTAETSAPAYLLHGPETDADDIVSATEARFKALTDADLMADLEAVRDRSGGTVGLSSLPQKAGPVYRSDATLAEPPACRTFSGQIAQNFRVSSFSSLTSGQRHSGDLSDYGAVERPEVGDRSVKTGTQRFASPPSLPPAEGPLTIFSFPRGAKPGTCLHEIFEHLDFMAAQGTALEKLVGEKLEKYGFEAMWQAPVCEMTRKVLAVPLMSEESGLILSQVPNADRVNEMAFYFPLNFITPGRLQQIFRAHGGPSLPADFPDQMGKLSFSPVQGFVKGFIDMVFQWEGRYYLTDWKSNFLGETVEEYGPNALNHAMSETFYILQYHIYTLALHRYLSLRLPGYSYEKHFGGVFYLFLRGMDPEKGPAYGIYRDRPSEALIVALAEGLIQIGGDHF